MTHNRIRISTGTMAVVVLLALLFWGWAAAAPAAQLEAESPTPAADDGACVALDPLNYLQNPSFEGEYSAYVPDPPIAQCPARVCTSVRTPAGWSPWWTTKGNDPLFYKMPEFTAAAHDFWYGPPRTRSGLSAQQLFTLYSTHEAGVYQQIATTPGVTYCLSAWGHSWTAQDDPIPEKNHGSCPSPQGEGDACSGPADGQLNQKIGLDPLGGTDPESASLVWGTPHLQYDSYGLFVVTATAQAETMTVFLYSKPEHPVKHNNAYWDDATLSAGRLTTAGLGDLAVMTLPTNPRSPSKSGSLTLSAGLADQGWTAVVDSSGGLTPTVNPLTGSGGGPLDYSFNTSGLANGVYTATVTVSSDTPTVGSPRTFDLKAIVTDQIYSIYLPFVQR